MISSELVDSSAVLIATSLVPGGPKSMDRELFAPMAALAIRSNAGHIALQHQNGLQGLTFPIIRGELPVIRGETQALIARQVADFITPAANELGISRYVASIIGILPRMENVPVALRGRLRGSRRIAVLPFGLTLNNKPRIRDMSWHSPSEAGRYLVGSRPGLSANAKHIILNRFLARRISGQI